MMEPGQRTDAMIARRLWKAIVMIEGGVHMLAEATSRKRIPLPPYSTDLDEAYRVVAKMQSHGWTSRISAGDDGRLRAVFAKPDGRLYHWSVADTAPMAICLAALAAEDGSNVEA